MPIKKAPKTVPPTGAEADLPLKEYKGFIWIGDQPGIRLSIRARSLDEAEAAVDAQYGEGHHTSIWNEDEAHEERGMS